MMCFDLRHSPVEDGRPDKDCGPLEVSDHGPGLVLTFSVLLQKGLLYIIHYTTSMPIANLFKL